MAEALWEVAGLLMMLGMVLIVVGVLELVRLYRANKEAQANRRTICRRYTEEK